MSEITDREILDVSLGLEDPNNFGRRITSTFLDHLPKDVIEYLQRYTGPIDCLYATSLVWTDGFQHIRKHRYRAWVNKSFEHAENESHNNNYSNGWAGPFVEEGKLIFIDGKAFVALPVYKNRVFGMAHKKKKKRDDGKSKRCDARTLASKRCKRKVVLPKNWVNDGDKIYCCVHSS